MARLHEGTIAIFDDSQQPTGNFQNQNDGPFGIAIPHPEMKKLRHELVLVIDGPENVRVAVEECLRRAATAAALAALIAAFASGGMTATNAAWAAFQAEFVRCAGEQVSAKIDDNSHWITWVA